MEPEQPVEHRPAKDAQQEQEPSNHRNQLTITTITIRNTKAPMEITNSVRSSSYRLLMFVIGGGGGSWDRNRSGTAIPVYS